jgi:hypothetical protein
MQSITLWLLVIIALSQHVRATLVSFKSCSEGSNDTLSVQKVEILFNETINSFTFSIEGTSSTQVNGSTPLVLGKRENS